MTTKFLTTAPCTQTAFSLYVDRILPSGYKFVVSNGDMFDPQGVPTAWVYCEKHLTHKMVPLTDGVASGDDILRAAQSCQECISEHAAELPPSRWPEGAEL